MSYPFVASFHDAGVRRGPIRGFLVHMAEGGGTVGYLSRENPNGVSVHYVIEYSGRTVQMLREDHMHTSIRIADGAAIRQDTGADGFGVGPARAVLGDWYDVPGTLGPNHATVAVEVEGFALIGPNQAQRSALIALAGDVRTRNAATIRGNLGHRDHNVKPCPGQLIPWDALGGHGLYALTPPDTDTGGPTVSYTVSPRPFAWYVKAGTTVHGYDPARPGGSVASGFFDVDSEGRATGIVDVTWAPGTDPGAPSGGPFLRVTEGTFDGLLILRDAVSLEPFTPVVPGVIDEAAVRKDQHAKDSAAVLRSLGLGG